MLEEQEKTNEVLNPQQRLKLKQAMRRNKAKIKLGRDRASRKAASQEVLKKRATKQARGIVLKKILKNRDKGDLAYSQRASIEKQLNKRKGAIDRLAKKLLPKVRQADRSKFSSKPAPKEKTNRDQA
jgi:hypothetical protein